jgi:hypothetical protein
MSTRKESETSSINLKKTTSIYANFKVPTDQPKEILFVIQLTSLVRLLLRDMAHIRGSVILIQHIDKRRCSITVLSTSVVL